MNRKNSKGTAEEKQSLLMRWSQEIAEKLPPSLEQSAKEYGAIIRKREIKSALGLVQMLLMYAVSNLSQKALAACACVIGVANVSDQAWQKKTVRSIPWLTYLLNETLPRTKICSRETAALRHRQIKLVDGSCIKQEGTQGEVIRIHMCYDISHGCMEEVRVSDQREAERISPLTITPGSVYSRRGIWEREEPPIHRISPRRRVVKGHAKPADPLEGFIGQAAH